MLPLRTHNRIFLGEEGKCLKRLGLFYQGHSYLLNSIEVKIIFFLTHLKHMYGVLERKEPSH